MKRALLSAALAALAFSCALDTRSDGSVLDEDADAEVSARVIGTAPNGLPVVASPELPFVEPVSLRSEKTSNEQFFCQDEWGWGCGPINRTTQQWSRYDASHSTTISGYGDPGEGTSNFSIWNGVPAKTITGNTGNGSVQWTIAFPSGSTCNTFGNCTYFVCIDQGIPWPRCIQTSGKSGATNEFTGEPWAANSWKRFTIAVWALAGSVPTSTTTETIYVWTSPGW